MDMKRNIRTMVLAAALLVSMAGTVSGYNAILPDPFEMTIGEGNTGTYTITVYTNMLGPHTITFDTKESLLYARLTGPDGSSSSTAMTTTDSLTWTAVQGDYWYDFTYEVQPQLGITHSEYTMEITDTGVNGATLVNATASPSSTVVPELPSFALAGIGAMVGLIALGRRKD